MPRIILNGDPVELPTPCTIKSLLAHHPARHPAFAVEVNKTVVPRREHDSRELREGDHVEIVTLVGGG